jgi:hypothetical protein
LRVTAALGWIIAATAAVPPVLAQPSVRVSAATRITLQTARVERGVEVTGSLVDDLGAPLSEHLVELVIDGPVGREKRALRTDDAGTFHAILDAPSARYRVLVKYGGDTAYAAAEATRDVDMSRADVRLTFIEPRGLRVDLDRPSHKVAVRSESAVGGVGLDIALLDEAGRELARGRTDANGAFRVELAAQTFGAPGVGRLVAQTSGDAQRAAARAEMEILRFRNTELALQVRPDTDRQGLVFTGTLRSGQSGIGNKAIGLFDGERHLTTIRTTQDGSFQHVAARSSLSGAPSATLHVQARFDTDAPWLGSSRSTVSTLRLQTDAPPSPFWLLVPLGLCATLLWLLTRRELQQRHDLRAAVTQRGPGFHPTRRGPAGPPQRTRISGLVLDASDQRPLAAARVTLACADQHLEVATDSAGRFDSGDVTPGTWQLRVSAIGYAAVTSHAVVPHRGEWSDVQVLLASLRSAAVHAYRPAATRALPSLALWETWTARETLDNALRNGLAPASFIQLTDRVERAAYAKVAPNADDVAAIERVAMTAISEMPDVTVHDEAADQSHSRNSSAPLRARIPHRR